MHKKATVLSIGFLFIFIVMGLASAVPPVTTLQQQNNLQILTYNFDTYKQGEDIEFQFHVFNTTKLLTNTSVMCGMHLSYNHQTMHIYTIKSMPYVDGNMGDFETLVNGNNFTRTGTYCGIAECNSTSQPGAVSFCFEVTPSGYSPDGTRINPLLYTLIVTSLIFLVLSFFVRENMIVIKLGLIITSILLTVLALNSALEVTRTSTQYTMILSAMIITITSTLLLLFYLLVHYIRAIAKAAKEIKQERESSGLI